MKRLLPLLAISLLAISMIVASCSTTNLRVVKINDIIDSLRTQFAPDPRTAVFDVAVRDSGQFVILRGETDSLAAKFDLLSEVQKVVGENVIDSVRVLPEPELGEKVYGIVDVSVGNIYQYPKFESQLVTQVLLGHWVRVLKEHHGWLYIQCEDKYLGWTQSGVIKRVTSPELDVYNTKKKLLVTSLYSTIKNGPTKDSGTISDAVMADLLMPVQRVGSDFKVELPDGRIGYIPSNDVDYYDRYMSTHKPTPQGIQTTAEKLIGFPYLWGGTSIKGMDCSGFVKTVFRMNGIHLPRDASQQVNVGEKIEAGHNFENLKKGDLLFFGTKAHDGKPEKIVHVAIYLGKGYYIQSSSDDRIRINSLLRTDTAFDKYNLDRYVTARRILPANEVSSKN